MRTINTKSIEVLIAKRNHALVMTGLLMVLALVEAYICSMLTNGLGLSLNTELLVLMSITILCVIIFEVRSMFIHSVIKRKRIE